MLFQNEYNECLNIIISAAAIGHRGECYDSSRAHEELGMLTPLPETIRKAIDWFRENRYLPEA